MAEQLIIHVKIDGFSPQKETGKGGTTATAAAAGGLAAAGVLKDVSGGPERGMKDLLIGDLTKSSSRFERFSKEGFNDLSQIYSFQDKGKLTSPLTRRYSDPDFIAGSVDVETGLSRYIVDNQAKIRAAGAALVWKAADSAVKVAQHRSGDSYANAQLNNAMKVVGYGAAIAMSGPAAPFVAAGIAVNEIANGIVQGMNYRFDRALEGNQIRNMKVIAGDMSYGRRRGAL